MYYDSIWILTPSLRSFYARVSCRPSSESAPYQKTSPHSSSPDLILPPELPKSIEQRRWELIRIRLIWKRTWFDLIYYCSNEWTGPWSYLFLKNLSWFWKVRSSRLYERLWDLLELSWDKERIGKGEFGSSEDLRTMGGWWSERKGGPTTPQTFSAFLHRTSDFLLWDWIISRSKEEEFRTCQTSKKVGYQR